MSAENREVWITGIGLVSCFGEGADLHWQTLGKDNAPKPIIEREKFAPYSVHPIPELDWSTQIPRRGDQRQMENWQRLGTYTAGLALEDAGVKEDEDFVSSMDLVVAAGGGERDIETDDAIMQDSLGSTDREKLLLERLPNDLRPTLFLAQLSNLLAGNISIVHKVTGSSRTYMGEATAGITALENSLSRIKSGQSTHILVGGSYHADRPDALLPHELGHFLYKGDSKNTGVQERLADGGGMMLGSAGAFLVLEEAEHAKKRGATPYAKLCSVASDLGNRADDKTKDRLANIVERIGVDNVDGIVSGASGVEGITQLEMDFLTSQFANAPIRSHANMIGQPLEANFPFGVALAALALKNQGFYAPFEAAESTSDTNPNSILVTTISHCLGEGMALVEKA